MFFKRHKSKLPPIARFKFPNPEGEPPEDPPNQYGMLPYEEWKKRFDHFKNIKGEDSMRNHYDGKKGEYDIEKDKCCGEPKYKYNLKCTFKSGRIINENICTTSRIEDMIFDQMQKGNGTKLAINLKDRVLLLDKESIEILKVSCIEEN